MRTVQVDGLEPQPPEGYSKLKKLWFYVLFQAINDLHDIKERANAFRWINSDRTSTGSFLWICNLIEVDPWKLRLACGQADTLKVAKQRLGEWNKRNPKY